MLRQKMTTVMCMRLRLSLTEPEPGQRRDRDEVAHDVPIVGPSFPGGLQTTTLFSNYAKHVVIPL